MENHHFFMGKSTISMAIFNSFLYVHQRVYPNIYQITIFQAHDPTRRLQVLRVAALGIARNRGQPRSARCVAREGRQGERHFDGVDLTSSLVVGFWEFLPSGYVKIAMERSTIFNGKIHYKWPFSIAMLNYQRVTSFNHQGLSENVGLIFPMK